MDRTQVMEQLAPITALATRAVEHNPGTRVISNQEVTSIRPGKGSRLIEVTKEGQKNMARFAGLPESIVEKVSPDTFGRVTTELLNDREKYDLMLKDGQVIDVTNPAKYRNVNPERVLTAIESSGGQEFHRVLVLHNYSAQVEVLAAEQQAVVRGDLIRAGALIAFSPIGTIEPFVQSYVLRLACTNGATTNTVLSQYKFKDNGGNIWGWLRKAARDSFKSVGTIAARYKELANEAISPEDRAMVLAGLLKEARVSIDVAVAVQARALQEPPQNAFEMMNLLTWATSHQMRDPVEVIRARHVAATFAGADTHGRYCPVCRRQR